MYRVSALTLLVALGMMGGVASDKAAAQERTWAGFYGGVHGGYAWGSASVRDVGSGINPGPFDYNPAGAFGGATGGYNMQFGNGVFGFEADVGYMDLSGSGIIQSAHSTNHQDLTLKGGAYGDITARLGYAFGRTLIYGKGGMAIYDGEAMQATTAPGYGPTGTSLYVGWTAGGGIEIFVTQNLSVKVEYLHFDFGTQSGYQTALVADPPYTPAGTQFLNYTTVKADSVKAGIAWHF